MSRKTHILRYVSSVLLFFFGFYLLMVYLPPSAFAYHDPPADQGHSPNTNPKDKDDPKEDDGYPCKKAKGKGSPGPPVFLKSGGFYYSHQDLLIPGRGLSIDMTRTYRSNDMYNGVIGHGWHFDYNARLYRTTDSQGEYYIVVRNGDGIRINFSENPDGTYTPLDGRHDTLVRNSDGTYTLTKEREPQTIKHNFDPHGELLSINDADGNQLILSYLADYKLEKITDSSGRVIAFFYGANGKIASITDPAGRTVSYDYDADGNLTSVTNPAGNTTTYLYDSNHNLIRIVDARGNIAHEMSYDSDGRLYTYTDQGGRWYIYYYPQYSYTRVRDPRNTYIRYYYNDTGNLTRKYVEWPFYYNTYASWDASINKTSTKDARGYTTAYTYDANGNVLTITDPLGNTTTYAYESMFNKVSSIIDPLGNLTTFEYDSRGNLIKETNALGGETQYAYDAQGNKISMTDANGNTTTYDYDGNGYLTSVTDALGNTNTYTYDVVGNQTSVTDALGNTNAYTYDSMGRVTSVTDPQGGVTTYTYDCCGLADETDANGNTTQYEYDAYGRLVKEINAEGGVTRYTYDSLGNLTKMTDANNKPTTYEYDRLNRLTKITDPLGHSTQYSYDATGNRISETNANGNTTTYQYDPLGRVIKTTCPLGYATTYNYDANGNLISETDAKGNQTQHEYDALGRPTKVIDALGNVAERTYDGIGNTASETDASGRLTYFEYDAVGRIVKEIRKVADNSPTPDGDDSVSQYAYDGNGNLTSFTDPNGNTTNRSYDALDRLTSETNPEGETTAFEYDAVGNRTKVTMPSGNEVVTTYDNMNRPAQISDSLGIIETSTYDPLGRRIQITDGNGNTKQFVYDAAGRMIQRVFPDGTIWSYNYDAAGKVVEKINSAGQKVQLTYNAAGLKTSVTDALGNTYAAAFDRVGNLISLTDPNGNTTTYEYDALNRRTKITYADGWGTTYAYDGEGRLISRTDPDGNTTSYEYDDLGLLIKRDFPGANDDVYTYDSRGNLLTATNQHSSISFVYDTAGRVTQEIQSGQTLSMSLDLANNQSTMTYPGGRQITEVGDKRGRLLAITEGGNPLFQFTYNGVDQPVQINYANGFRAEYSYNQNNWLTQIRHQQGANPPLLEYNYAYDAAGQIKNVEKAHNPANSERYTYDANDRLTDFRRGNLDGNGDIPTPTYAKSYALDSVSNWNNVTVNGVTEIRTHNSVNAYTNIDGTSLAYNKSGNLLDDGIQLYEYDYEHRLAKVTRKADGLVLAEFQYDALGRRVRKIAGGVTTDYFYKDRSVIEERVGGITTATYVHGAILDQILSMDRNGQRYYHHTNAQGSVEAVTDQNGSLVEHYQYNPYGQTEIFDVGGNPLSTSAIGNPYMFTGRRFDFETGLYFYRARYYSPSMGRFTSRDMAGYRDGMNLYEYVRSNPIMYTDPLGLVKTKVKDCVSLTISFDLSEYLSWLPGSGDWGSEVSGTLKQCTVECIPEKEDPEYKECEGNPEPKEPGSWEATQITLEISASISYSFTINTPWGFSIPYTDYFVGVTVDVELAAFGSVFLQTDPCQNDCHGGGHIGVSITGVPKFGGEFPGVKLFLYGKIKITGKRIYECQGGSYGARNEICVSGEVGLEWEFLFWGDTEVFWEGKGCW